MKNIEIFWAVLWIWIQIQIGIHRSSPFLLDPDPFFGSGSGSRWHMIFSLNSWQNSECFTFLKFENPSSHSKVIIFLHWIQLFCPKFSIFGLLALFSDVTLISGDGIGWFFFTFLTKSTKLWCPITFEPLDRFSNFKKVKHLKFQALSIGFGSGSAKTSWIRIRFLKSGSKTLILSHFIQFFNDVVSLAL